LLVAVGVTLAGGAWAEAHRQPGRGVPARAAHKSDVLTTVRARARDPRAKHLEALRANLQRAPHDEARATEVAQAYLARSRESGDPRDLGRAEAALAPWWDLAAPPPAVWLLRGTLRQSRHDFDGALADLDGLLIVDPNNAQAWLTRAVVLGVQARYGDALPSCDALKESTSALTLAACRAPILALTGRMAAANAELASTLPLASEASTRAWVHALVGEIADWRGDEANAEQHLRVALAFDPSDRYVRTELADLWLDENRCDEATALLEGREQDDGALLRLALAARCTHAVTAAGFAEMLRERFQAARARGESLHGREESRAARTLDGDTARALTLAAQNWRVQREPADARVFLEAALAAHDRAAAAPVLGWLATSGFEGARIRTLAAAVEKLP
jgi:tetratricopeptide (TPR) repeat protein